MKYAAKTERIEDADIRRLALDPTTAEVEQALATLCRLWEKHEKLKTKAAFFSGVSAAKNVVGNAEKIRDAIDVLAAILAEVPR